MEIVILLAYATIITWYAIHTDGPKGRLSTLEIDGARVDGWRVVSARSFANRRLGLLNHSDLGPRAGLLLARARVVHTLGMVFAIDLVFLDAKGRVLGVRPNVAPGEKRVAGPRGTRQVLELAAYAVSTEPRLKEGAVVRFVEAAG